MQKQNGQFQAIPNWDASGFPGKNENGPHGKSGTAAE
jgi:hypothetical protein